MDVFQSRHRPAGGAMVCIDMHTTGEPTRIIIDGYPDLSGTLLEQRAEAKVHHDKIRERLLLEPRGHFDMYGAILRQRSELIDQGHAHIATLFATNSGYSTMCGHATIALGRLLLDTHDTKLFPRRNDLQYDMANLTAALDLHAPCGLVKVTVPIMADGSRSDPSRPVSFLSVPSFATGINVTIPLPATHRWPQLEGRTSVTADFCYGGAFYCVVSAAELGLKNGLKSVDFSVTDNATRLLKAAINDDPSLRYLFQHPDHDDLGFLYSIMVKDTDLGRATKRTNSTETGLCYFADQQIDRSPTGSAVAARAALAFAKGELALHEARAYHSLLSNVMEDDKGAFVGQVVDVLTEAGGQALFPIVRVQVEGYAFYTGTHVFFVEEDDPLGSGGFVFTKLS